MSKQVNITFPPVYEDLFRPFPYKVYYGGRGGAKSWQFARALVLKASSAPLRILCAREYQNSIADSVHQLLVDQINLLGLRDYYDVTEKYITGAFGSEFFFKGLHTNIEEAVKGAEGIDICWVEEAHRVSQKSWDILLPTIRKEGSETWISFNTNSQDDPVYTTFVKNRMPSGMATVHKVNYDQNPWFPEKLRMQMEYCKRVDYDKYLHIWEGQPQKHSEAVIFRGKYRVESFETPSDVDRFYYGADWGFANDPSTLIRSFIKERKLYVDYEAYGVGVELDELPQLFRSVPGANKWPIKADCSRPETISHVRNKGKMNVLPCKKWDGSVEDGIEYLRSFEEIIIHTRCVKMAEEAGCYSYKTDRVSGEVLPIILDADNHCWDALRYGHDDQIRSGNVGLLDFMVAAAAKAKAQQASAGAN